jgi:hypothetical protein
MHAISNLLGTDEQGTDWEGPDGTVRQIGEILPFVMARYQLAALDRAGDVSDEFSI